MTTSIDFIHCNMKKLTILLPAFMIILTSFCAYSQLSNTTFITSECLLNCGANFIYNSKFVFTEDSIKIISPSEKVVGQYVIVNTRAKWKDVNYHGTAKIVAMNTLDSSIGEFKLNLRKAKGFLKMFEKGECQIILKIESDEKTAYNKLKFVRLPRQ